MIQVKRMNACARALADDEVNAKILHRGIQDFFDGRLQAVNFVEEENLAQFERGEDGGEVAFAFENRPGAGFYGDVELVGYDLRERSFPRPGGP